MTKKDITQLSYEITGLAIKVHKELGPGLLESVYEKCLKYELESNGYKVVQQMKVPFVYKGITLESELKLDLMVNDAVIIELKTVETLLPVHEAQLLTYMKLL
jgi:GxxExxY protein